MTIEQFTIGPDVTVLQVHGRIRLGNDSQELESRVDDLLDAHAQRIIFDLSGLTFLDSTGIGIIVMCGGKLKKVGGELRISDPVANVARTLALCKITEIIPVLATIDQATSSFTPAAGAA